MGGEHSIHRDPNTGGIQFEQCHSKRQDVQKYQKDVPASSYARIATRRPKLLPEVQDTIKHHKGSSRISGDSNGNKLPTYQLLKNHGVFYEGQWKNGLENGRGSARGLNGTYIEAYFVGGKAQGSGIHVYPDGSYYSGQFRGGVYNGKGKFFYKLNKMTYQGEWKDGKPHGKGRQDFPQIGIYDGHFQNGLKQGKGQMKWKDGRQYQGQFHEGYMHGEGVLRKKKGYYKGRFDRNNKVSGQMKTQLGVYDGPFVKGQMSGKGRFSWNNGNLYEGQFKYNRMHGKGIMTLKNGQKFVGEWQNGINVKIDQNN